jgi:alkanesulfonate monooxygenase SsuD/methylene tetrahydromethanopterin reductase-like flavin-dependent oxidoreductase (luciferase family)
MIATTRSCVRGPATLDEVTGQVKAAADAGFGAAWSAQAPGWDALTLLAVTGSRVPEISLGTAVVPVPQRHPLVLAGQALSVQAATGNRLTLGIGAGIAMMTKGMFGIAADRPAQRMREYLSVLIPLLHRENVSYQGQTVSAAGRPAPRVIAGFLVCVTSDPGEARERIAKQFGIAGQVPEYRAVLDREGADGPQDVAVTGDEETVARHLRRLADAGATGLMASPFGTPEEQNRTISVLAELARSGPRPA